MPWSEFEYLVSSLHTALRYTERTVLYCSGIGWGCIGFQVEGKFYRPDSFPPDFGLKVGNGFLHYSITGTVAPCCSLLFCACLCYRYEHQCLIFTNGRQI